MNTNTDTAVQSQLTWPLPGTQIAQAHLTWSEWTARQATQVASARYQALAPQAKHQTRSAISIIEYAAPRLIWPLPATQLPNARLTWLEWLETQSARSSAGQSRQGMPDLAA
jgi:hypothetical protein